MINLEKVIPVLRRGNSLVFVNANVNELPIKDNRYCCVVSFDDRIVKFTYVKILSLFAFNPSWEVVEIDEGIFSDYRDKLRRYLPDEQMVRFNMFFENLQNLDNLRESEGIDREDVEYTDDTFYPNEAFCGKCNLYSEGKCQKLGDVNVNGWCKMWFTNLK